MKQYSRILFPILNDIHAMGLSYQKITAASLIKSEAHSQNYIILFIQ